MKLFSVLVAVDEPLSPRFRYLVVVTTCVQLVFKARWLKVPPVQVVKSLWSSNPNKVVHFALLTSQAETSPLVVAALRFWLVVLA